MANLNIFFLFDGVNDEVVKRVLSDNRCRTICYTPKQVIYSREIFRQSLGFIQSGTAFVNNGGVIMRRLTEGTSFGAAALFTDKTQYVTEIVAETKCKIIFIDQSLIIDIMRENFQIAENYIRFQSDRINFLNSLIDNYSAQTIESKLARFLISSAYENEVTLEFNMSKLSSSLGIGRASLYRVLGEMEKDGIIERRGKQIKIINIIGLKNRL